MYHYINQHIIAIQFYYMKKYVLQISMTDSGNPKDNIDFDNLKKENLNHARDFFSDIEQQIALLSEEQQSILYVLHELFSETVFEVEIIETVLGGSNKWALRSSYLNSIP